ncbi:MAG: TIGR03986 family CRISPR-associated RAMP protein [Ardenticatenaceae bacterium]|nr:TIGR03986 family CRISPR-associated RAMP protein [Ardenticatenaceae bacterium]
MRLRHDNPQKPRIYQKKRGSRPVGPEYEVESVAPYNFVPLPEKIVWANPPIPHNVYAEEAHTGTIHCELTTMSPVYIRGMLEVDQFIEQSNKKPKDVTAKEKEQNAHFFSTDPNHKVPLIPGSSLRGMLRQIVEIAGFGRVRHVADQPTFTFRAVAVQGEDPLNQPYEDALGKYGRKVQAGYLKLSGESWSVEPAQTPKQVGWSNESWAKWIKIADEDIKLANFNHFNDDGYKPQIIPISFRRGDWVPKSNWQKGNENRLSIIVAAPGEEEFEGILVTAGSMAETGGSSPRKNHTIVLPRDKKRETIPVPESVIDGYRKGMTPYQEENLDAWAGSEWGIFADGKPVFFVEENNVVTYIGHNPNFRVPAKLSGTERAATPLDFVPGRLLKEKERRPDLGDVIFGWIEEENSPIIIESDGSEKREIKSFAGRVFISDARYQEAKNGLWYSEKAIIPQILAGPKPTTFQHYLVQNKDEGHDPDNKMALAHYGTAPKETQIRGYKNYWHKGKKPPIDAKDLKWDKEKGSYANESQLTRIRPLQSDVQFSFDIRFENLRPEELGALLWALQLPGKDGGPYYHKLGMGKPLGMGAVCIKPKLSFSQRMTLPSGPDNSEERKGRYGKLFANNMQTWHIPEYKDVESKFFLDAFINHVMGQLRIEGDSVSFYDLEQIQALLEMLRWREGTPDWLKQTRYMEIEHEVPRNTTINEYVERPVLPESLSVVGKKRKAVSFSTSAESISESEANRQTGTVKSFSDSNRYGFIIPVKGGKDIFVHRDQLAPGLSSLNQGQRVTFLVEQDEKGRLQALDVRLVER